MGPGDLNVSCNDVNDFADLWTQMYQIIPGAGSAPSLGEASGEYLAKLLLTLMQARANISNLAVQSVESDDVTNVHVISIATDTPGATPEYIASDFLRSCGVANHGHVCGRDQRFG